MSAASVGGGREALRLPTRSDLGRPGVETLSHGGSGNPDVLLVPWEGARCGAVIVKDYAPRGAWVRGVVGPWLAQRERDAIARLASLACVPPVLGVIDRLAFVLEYRPGEILTRSLARRLPDGFFERLRGAISAMHDAGVVHLDLKHRSNLLVDADGQPVVIDFASAVCFRPGSLLYRFYRPQLIQYDLAALEKWRVRIAPEAEPVEGAPRAR